MFSMDGSMSRGVTGKDNVFFSLTELTESLSKCSLHCDDRMLQVLTIDVNVCFVELSQGGEVRERIFLYISGKHCHLALKRQNILQHLKGRASLSLETSVQHVKVTCHIHHEVQLFQPIWMFQFWIGEALAFQESFHLLQKKRQTV